jgi:hypothetical protein
VPALEQIHGVRVVATPGALDRAPWKDDDSMVVWRIAPDEAFGWRAGAWDYALDLDDPDAIIELEAGCVGSYLTPEDVGDLRRHCEFDWPAGRPALVQGKVAGVPVKVYLDARDSGDLLLVQGCYADELRSRLRW